MEADKAVEVIDESDSQDGENDEEGIETIDDSDKDDPMSEDDENADDDDQEEEYSFIKIGGRVSHMKFGHGVILRYTGKGDALKLMINFDDYGKKELVLSYAHLKFLN